MRCKDKIKLESCKERKWVCFK